MDLSSNYLPSSVYHVKNEGYPEDGRFQMETIPAELQSKYKAYLLDKAVTESKQVHIGDCFAIISIIAGNTAPLPKSACPLKISEEKAGLVVG